jgi:hypothetical protein
VGSAVVLLLVDTLRKRIPAPDRDARGSER